jgi:hypothetical protein
MAASSPFSRYVLAVLPGAVVGLLAVGGVAVATEESPPVINGCVDKKTSLLRIATEAKPCNTKSESPLSWNQEGPSGPAGSDADPAITTALDERLDAIEAGGRTHEFVGVNGTSERVSQECGPNTEGRFICHTVTATDSLFTYLGRVSAESLTITDATSFPGCVTTTTEITYTTSDGDLYVESDDGSNCPLDPEAGAASDRHMTANFIVTGGTGKFDQATGDLHQDVRTDGNSNPYEDTIFVWGSVTLAE